MEGCLRPLGFMKLLENNNHQAENTSIHIQNQSNKKKKKQKKKNN